MNVPNFLTILRIILVPVIVILLIQEKYFNALIVLTISGMTDILDGYIARQFNMQTVLGAYMDPIADKALMASCFITLAATGMIPAWLTVIVISRDVIILLGILMLFLMSISVEIRPAGISKATTVIQVITVFAVLFVESFFSRGLYVIVHPMYWLTAIFTILSGLHYMIRGIRIVNSQP